MNKKHLLLILLLPFLVYSNTFFNSFIWDDEDLIVKNSQIKSLKNIPQFFIPQKDDPYRPLRKLLFALNFSFFGLKPGFYHLVNVSLHLLNLFLFYFLILEIFKDENLALFAALLFGVNPAWNEAIVWIKNSSDLVVTLFFLFSFKFYLNRKTFMSLVFLFLSLLTKEIAFAFPLIISLYTLVFEGKKELKRTCPFWLLSIFYFIFLWIIYKGAGAKEISPGAGVFLGFKILLRYFLILLFPFYLNPERKVVFPHYIFDTEVIAGFFIFCLVTFIILKKRKKKLIFAYFWLILNLLPVLNPGIVLGRPLAEHRLYLPGVGFSLLIAAIFKSKKTFFYILIPLFAIMSFKRNFDWKNPLIFWQKTAKVAPYSSRAWTNLAYVWKEKGDFKKAEKFYLKAISLDPKDDNANTGLIEVYIKTGRLKKAKELINKFFQLRPDVIKVQYQLAEVFVKEGRMDEAIKVLKRIITIFPSEFDAYNQLGLYYHQIGAKKEAVDILMKLINLNPNYAMAYNNLGTIFYMERNYQRAVEFYQKAVKVLPTFSEAYYNLANTLDEIGNKREAIKYYKKAVNFAPDYSDAWYNLGMVMLEENKFREAAGCFKKVMELEPENEEVRNKYEEAKIKVR